MSEERDREIVEVMWLLVYFVPFVAYTALVYYDSYNRGLKSAPPPPSMEQCDP